LARKHAFLNAEFTERWKESYQSLQSPEQNGTDKAVIALLKQKPTPGMRVKPIEPDKYYYEARISDGGRLIHRTHEGTIYFIDIVSHDDIEKYSRFPSSRSRSFPSTTKVQSQTHHEDARRPLVFPVRDRCDHPSKQ